MSGKALAAGNLRCQGHKRCHRLFGSWSSLWAGGDFKAEFSGCCGRPCFLSKRRASIDAAADGREFSVCLRGIHILHPASKARQLIIFLRPDNQVPVIFHQTIRKQPSARSSHGFLKNRLKRDEIFILRKDRHPRVGPVQHMINPTTRSCSFWSSHVDTIPKSLSLVNKRFLTPFVTP